MLNSVLAGDCLSYTEALVIGFLGTLLSVGTILRGLLNGGLWMAILSPPQVEEVDLVFRSNSLAPSLSSSSPSPAPAPRRSGTLRDDTEDTDAPNAREGGTLS